MAIPAQNGSAPSPEREPPLNVDRETSPESHQRERANLALDLTEAREEKESGTLKQAVDALKVKGADKQKALEKGENPKEFNWMTTTMNVALLAVGAVVGYQAGKWAVKKVAEKAEEAITDGIEKVEASIFSWKTAALLAIAAGAAFKGKDLFHWAQEKWNCVFTEGSIGRFVAKLEETGSIKKAYAELDYTSKDPYVEALSQKLKVEPRHLAELKNVGYGQFLAHRKKDSKMSFLTKTLDVFGVDVEDVDIPITDVDDEARRVKEEGIIMTYIQSNKDGIAIDQKTLEEMTMGEILEKITKRDMELRKEKASEAIEKGEARLTDDPETLKPGWDGIVSAAKDTGKSKEEYEKGLISETLKAGGTILENDEIGTIVYKNGEGLLISSVAIFGSTLKNLPKTAIHLSDGNYEGAADDLYSIKETWSENGGWRYVGTGVALGFMVGLVKGNITEEVIRGGKWGFLGPAGVLWNTVKTIQKSEKGMWKASAWIEKLQKDFEFHSGSLQRLITKDPEKYKALIKKQISQEGREYLNAYDEMETAYLKHYGKGTAIKDFATIRRDKVLPGHLAEVEEMHFQRFVNLWKTYRETLGLGTRFPINVDSYADKREDLVKMIEEVDEEFNPRVKKLNLTEEKTRLNDPEVSRKPMAEQVEELRKTAKNADDFQRTAIEEYVKMKKAGASAEELDLKVSSTKKELTEVRDQFNTHLSRLSEASQHASPQEQKLLRDLLDKDLAKGMGLRAIKVEMKSRGKWAFVLGVAETVIATNELRKTDPEAYATMKLQELAKEVGPEALQMVFDVMSPYGLSDWASLIRGKAWLTGKEMSGWDKLSSVVFGSYSLFSDSLATLGAGVTAEVGGAGGAAIYGAGNLVEASLRSAGHSDDIIRVAKEMLPEISALASDVGGYKNLIKHLTTAKSISNTAGNAVTVVNVANAAWSGLQIMFDTKDQKPIAVEGDQDEDPMEGDGISQSG